MKKILLVGNAANIDTHAVDFACYIAAITHSSLTGLLLQDELLEKPVMKFTYGMPYIETITAVDKPGYATLKNSINKTIDSFAGACSSKGIKSHVQLYDAEDAVAGVMEESRFADLMLVVPDTSFEKNEAEHPSHFVKEILAGAECPVLVTPRDFTGIDEVVFAYDGSRSAVYAIKQFTYLFPELADKKLQVLQVNEEADLLLTEKEKIADLLKMHYSGIGFHVLHGKPSEALLAYLRSRKNALVVMGAYGRGWLSELFIPSRAGALLKSTPLPFFIAHH
jgi:nucleotide-binding universal stress UspA family protein